MRTKETVPEQICHLRFWLMSEECNIIITLDILVNMQLVRFIPVTVGPAVPSQLTVDVDSTGTSHMLSRLPNSFFVPIHRTQAVPTVQRLLCPGKLKEITGKDGSIDHQRDCRTGMSTIVLGESPAKSRRSWESFHATNDRPPRCKL